MIVLDASVVLKWFLQEESSEKALEIRQRYLSSQIDISVPCLILSEVSNVLRYEPNYTQDSTKEALSSILDLGIDIVVLTKEIYELAIELAYKYDVTVYDAQYLALSQDLGFELITADEKLFERLKEQKVPPVKLLKHYSF